MFCLAHIFTVSTFLITLFDELQPVKEVYLLSIIYTFIFLGRTTMHMLSVVIQVSEK